MWAGMFDLTLQQLLQRLGAFVIVSGLAGVLIAGAARLLGDRGPVYDGKLSPNPLTHLDLLGLVTGLFAQVGWIRPIAIDAREVRGGALGVVLAVLVALGLLAGLAVLLWSFRSLLLVIIPDPTFSAGSMTFLRTFVSLSLGFAVFNLIPLPPLAMGAVLASIAPKLHSFLELHDLWVRLALVLILLSGLVQSTLLSILRPVWSVAGI